MKKNKFSFIAIVLIVIAASCKKDDATTTVPKVTDGVYILNQGAFGHNDAALTYYDFGTHVATTDYYYDVNNKAGLGDDATDFIVYGSKMYVVVDNSNTVAVVNALTAKLIDTISFISGNVDEQPQSAIGYGNHVFVSCNNGAVAVIDTTTLAITQYITVGTNPYQMAISGSNLYVSNTGGYNYPNAPDSTVSVIDLNTLTQTTKITVGEDPGCIAADNSGNIYVACAGNYPAPASLVKVNTSANTVTFSADTGVSTVRFYNNYLYVTPAYGSTAASVRVLNTNDFSAVTSSFITDGTAVIYPYGLDIDGVGNVYVDDAISNTSSIGKVYCFDQTGTKKFSFSTGAFPCKVIPIHQ